MSVGFRIVETIERVPQELVNRYAQARLATANVADVMWRFGAMDAEVRAFGSAASYLAGPAVTVRVRRDDNLMVHKALEMANPGDVIVVESRGGGGQALIGELMCRYAAERGIGGFVLDGLVRDGGALGALGLPVYARGLTPAGPYKDGPGEINTPVSCAGVAVCPGDMILGDDDGVVVVPRESAGEVFPEALEVERSETQIVERIADGRWERSWIDEKLTNGGCAVVRSN